MPLHTKLVTLRKQKKFSQTDLAELLNVSRQAISRWEVGAAVPNTANLKVLGELYGVPVDYLLNDDISEYTKSTQGIEEKPISTKNTPNRMKYKPHVIWFVAVIIVVIVLICALVSRKEGSNKITPMNDLYVETAETHSDGTFLIE